MDDLEERAAEKGAIQQLLDEKWRKVYKTNISRGLFTHGQMRDACGQDLACMAKEKRGLGGWIEPVTEEVTAPSTALSLWRQLGHPIKPNRNKISERKKISGGSGAFNAIL